MTPLPAKPIEPLRYAVRVAAVWTRLPGQNKSAWLAMSLLVQAAMVALPVAGQVVQVGPVPTGSGPAPAHAVVNVRQLTPPHQVARLPKPPEVTPLEFSPVDTAVFAPRAELGLPTPMAQTPLAFTDKRIVPSVVPEQPRTTSTLPTYGIEIVYDTASLRSFQPRRLVGSQSDGATKPSWADLALPDEAVISTGDSLEEADLLIDPSPDNTLADELLPQDDSLPSPESRALEPLAEANQRSAEELVPTPPAETGLKEHHLAPEQPPSASESEPASAMDWIPDILPPSRNRSAGSAAARSEGEKPTLDAHKKDPWLYDPEKGPQFYQAVSQPPPQHDMGTRLRGYDPNAFLALPQSSEPPDPLLESTVYRGKFPVPTQRPLVELWRPLYTGGIYDRGKEWFGRYNLVMPHFMVYGDMRTAVGINRNQAGDFNNLATRLNLDMDLEITATERLHAFVGPLDRGGEFTHFDFTDDFNFVDRSDFRFDTLFFEGDAGAILGGLQDSDAPFDLPFSFGFLPLFYQNGIWAADNVIGAAVALPAKHSRALQWSNFDATFFWAADQVNSDAFAGDDNAAEFFGTAWFIDAYDGYIETNYAFVHDDVGLQRSYHNLSVAYSRRYFHRISNAIRFITNFGQALPSDQRTADGHLLLIENSLITAAPNTFVPYCNFFYGQGRTQSLARAGVAGGILNNTGINFETDGLTGYPTLDATAVNTTGGAIGVNLLGANFSHQLILEFAALSANGGAALRNANGDQYAFGIRYQKPLNNAWIFRTDHMVGWLEGEQDIRGSRVELRWKF